MRRIRQRLAEQAFGRSGIAQPREHEVDRGAGGIDGSVEVAPTALDTNVGLIDPPGPVGWLEMTAQPRLQFGTVALPEGIRRVPNAALCMARLRPTRTRRATGSQWVARPAVLSTARYAADRLRNVGLPNRQKPQGMSCEAMGEFRVSAPRGGLRTASIYAFLGWDLMRPGFPPFDGRVPAFSERWNQICSNGKCGRSCSPG